MVSFKKFKELIQRGCCVVEQEDTQEQRVDQHEDRQLPALTHSDEDVTAEEEEEEEIDGEMENNYIYQTDYVSMNIEDVDTSFDQNQQLYKDILDQKYSPIFTDNPWMPYSEVPNAFEYTTNDNQTEEDMEDIYYEVNDTPTNTKDIDRLYEEARDKYAHLIHEVGSKNDWKTTMVSSYAFLSLMPADINPYVVTHPSEEPKLLSETLTREKTPTFSSWATPTTELEDLSASWATETPQKQKTKEPTPAKKASMPNKESPVMSKKRAKKEPSKPFQPTNGTFDEGWPNPDTNPETAFNQWTQSNIHKQDAEVAWGQ